MADRSFQDKQYALIKREVKLYAAVDVGVGGAVTLMKWNYPTFGAGASANISPRTYSAAPLATALPTGNANPLQYNAGAEGVRSVVRTGTGAWTIKLQDNYQRLLDVSYLTENVSGASTVVSCARLASAGSVNFNAVGGSEFAVLFSSAAGVAADPASGDRILLSFTLADATEP